MGYDHEFLGVLSGRYRVLGVALAVNYLQLTVKNDTRRSVSTTGSVAKQPASPRITHYF
jgi:hypothetical protein